MGRMTQRARTRVRENPAVDPVELVQKIINGYASILTNFDKIAGSSKAAQLTGPLGDPGSLALNTSLMEAVTSTLIASDKVRFYASEYLALVYVYERYLRSAAKASRKARPEFVLLADLCSWIRYAKGGIKRGYLDGGGVSEILAAARTHAGEFFPLTRSWVKGMRNGWKKRPMMFLPMLHPLVLAPEILALRTEIADGLPTWTDQWEKMWSKLNKLGLELPRSFPLLDKDIGYPFVLEGLVGPYTVMNVCDYLTLVKYLSAKDRPLTYWIMCKILRTTMGFASNDKRIEHAIRAIEEWSIEEDDRSFKEIGYAITALTPLRSDRKTVLEILTGSGKEATVPQIVAENVLLLAMEVQSNVYNPDRQLKGFVMVMDSIAQRVSEVHATAAGYKTYSSGWSKARDEAQTKLVGVIANAVPGF